MAETLQGIGLLEEHPHSERKHEVRYQFTITTDVLERPGSPRVATGRRSQGSVESIAGEVFPVGFYRLTTADQEILRVQNLGAGGWFIVSST
jgi:hypothetical protein